MVRNYLAARVCHLSPKELSSANVLVGAARHLVFTRVQDPATVAALDEHGVVWAVARRTLQRPKEEVAQEGGGGRRVARLTAPKVGLLRAVAEADTQSWWALTAALQEAARDGEVKSQLVGHRTGKQQSQRHGVHDLPCQQQQQQEAVRIPNKVGIVARGAEGLGSAGLLRFRSWCSGF